MKFKNLFKRSHSNKQSNEKAQQKNYAFSDIEALLSLTTTSTASTARQALQLFDESSAVGIPVGYITSAFCAIDPVIKIGDEIIKDHPVLQLINRPSPFFNKYLFREFIATEYLVTGETYIIALGSVNRPPLEIMPITVKNVDIPVDNNRPPELIQVTNNMLSGNYKLNIVKNVVRYFDSRNSLRELKQIRNYSNKSNSMYRGRSPLLDAAQEVKQDILGSRHNLSLLEKGGKISLIVNIAQEFESKEDFDDAKDNIKSQYGGSSNAGEILVTANEGLDIKHVSSSNVDMDFFNLRKLAKQSIAQKLKFPLVLLTVDAATLNNYKEGKLALIDDAVLPLFNQVYGGLSEFLLPRFGLDPAKATITYDPLSITPLLNRTLDELMKRKDLKLESINELRKLIGRDDVTDGDVVRVSGSDIPLGEDLFSDDDEVLAQGEPNND